MSIFENVSIVKKANVYFDGKVVSRTVLWADGTKKTLGFMLPGDYEFGTDEAEVMEIISGDLDVMLPHSKEWISVVGGETFNVPAHARFKLKVRHATDYCCSFIS